MVSSTMIEAATSSSSFYSSLPVLLSRGLAKFLVSAPLSVSSFLQHGVISRGCASPDFSPPIEETCFVLPVKIRLFPG